MFRAYADRRKTRRFAGLQPPEQLMQDGAAFAADDQVDVRGNEVMRQH
jgi:hypothetical protein